MYVQANAKTRRKGKVFTIRFLSCDIESWLTCVESRGRSFYLRHIVYNLYVYACVQHWQCDDTRNQCTTIVYCTSLPYYSSNIALQLTNQTTQTINALLLFTVHTCHNTMVILVTPCWKVQSGLISNRSHPDWGRIAGQIALSNRA